MPEMQPKSFRNRRFGAPRATWTVRSADNRTVRTSPPALALPRFRRPCRTLKREGPHGMPVRAFVGGGKPLRQRRRAWRLYSAASIMRISRTAQEAPLPVTTLPRVHTTFSSPPVAITTLELRMVASQ